MACQPHALSANHVSIPVIWATQPSGFWETCQPDFLGQRTGEASPDPTSQDDGVHPEGVRRPRVGLSDVIRDVHRVMDSWSNPWEDGVNLCNSQGSAGPNESEWGISVPQREIQMTAVHPLYILQHMRRALYTQTEMYGMHFASKGCHVLGIVLM